jgi:hypothetical protein
MSQAANLAQATLAHLFAFPDLLAARSVAPRAEFHHGDTEITEKNQKISVHSVPPWWIPWVAGGARAMKLRNRWLVDEDA